MNTPEFLTKYLNSPILAHRSKSLLCLFEEVELNQKAMGQLSVNLESNNLDIVFNILRILQTISLEDGSKVKPISKKIAQLGRKTNHFTIASLCRDILAKTGDKTLSKTVNSITKRITPKMKPSTNSEMFFDNCDYFLEHSLGAQDHKYELSNICRAFRYDCKKATKQVFAYMRILGYKKNIQYWKDRPSRWQYDFGGSRYETRLNYFARHAIQMFLMWCVNNLTATKEDWSEFLINERKWDASIPKLKIQVRPSFLHFVDIKEETSAWIKRRIKKDDAYELFNSKNKWIPLYENTNFKYEDKSFDRYVATCFIRPPISDLSRKIEFTPPHYNCRSCYINELPTKVIQNGRLYLDDSNSRHEDLKDKLLPSYGIVSEDFDDYVKLFPAREIIDHFKLTQQKNSLDYYRGKELVVCCINWRDGYYRNVGRQGEDRFELANYGHLLMIKTKYLKKYLKEKNLGLIAVGRIWKHKVDKWSREYNYNDKKSSKHKWLSFKTIKF